MLQCVTVCCSVLQESYSIIRILEGPLDPAFALANVALSTEGCPKIDCNTLQQESDAPSEEGNHRQ